MNFGQNSNSCTGTSFSNSSLVTNVTYIPTGENPFYTRGGITLDRSVDCDIADYIETTYTNPTYYENTYSYPENEIFSLGEMPNYLKKSYWYFNNEKCWSSPIGEVPQGFDLENCGVLTTDKSITGVTILQFDQDRLTSFGTNNIGIYANYGHLMTIQYNDGTVCTGSSIELDTVNPFKLSLISTINNEESEKDATFSFGPFDATSELDCRVLGNL